MAQLDLTTGTIQTEGFEELTKKLTVLLPVMVREMAFTVDAKVAAIGRKAETSGASALDMGKPQRKSNRWSGSQIRSKWDSHRGWVSTTRPAAAKIGGMFSMGHFSFKGNKANKDSVVATYTNQLANLWSHETKAYTKKSPYVGQPGYTKSWKVGEKRPAKYNWSTVATILSTMESQAIAKTEAQFEEEFKKVF